MNIFLAWYVTSTLGFTSRYNANGIGIIFNLGKSPHTARTFNEFNSKILVANHNICEEVEENVQNCQSNF